MCDLNDKFRIIANKVASCTGSVWAFVASIVVIIAWALLGPKFEYSDTWQLVINTGTTIITFLMVFIIQNTQNRNDKAMQLKLDEIILAMKSARNSFIHLEDMKDSEIKLLEKTIQKTAQKKAPRRRRRRTREKKHPIIG